MLLAIFVACLSVAAQQTWTVDDDGPADFTTLQAAADAASDGDVLLVEAGSYAGFVTAKGLTLVGAVGGQPVLVSTQVSVSAAPRFTMSGLEMESVALKDVPGVVVIDHCTAGTLVTSLHASAIDIKNCGFVEVTRCTITGRDDFNGGHALACENSTASISSCTLLGGKGHDGEATGDSGGSGGHAVYARLASHVVIAGCSLTGGENGESFLFTPHNGDAGAGVKVPTSASPSTVVLRGVAANTIVGGWEWDDSPFGWGHTGESIDMVGGELVFSGVTIASPIDVQGGTVAELTTPEPFLVVEGADLPGLTRRIQLYGEPGSPAVLLGSLSAMPLTVGSVDGPLWPDLSAVLLVLPVVTVGDAPPLTIPVKLPAASGFEGLTLHLQAVFLDVPGTFDDGKHFSSNPSNIVMRFSGV